MRGGLPNFIMELIAPSKINLRLKVEGRRDDGYHLLSMLNVATSVSDRVRCEFSAHPIGADEGAGGPLASVLMEHVPAELAELPMGFLTHVKAVHLLAERLKTPLHCSISIEKGIPLGGGLGGASSDAAAVLVAAGRFLERELQRAEASEGGGMPELAGGAHEIWQAVQEVALAVGGDVPFFGRGGMAFVSGIGELVAGVRLADAGAGVVDGVAPGAKLVEPASGGVGAVLLTPRFGCATPEVYRKFRELVPDLGSGLGGTAGEQGDDVALRQRLGSELAFVNPFLAGQDGRGLVNGLGNGSGSGSDEFVRSHEPVLRYEEVLELVENDLEEAACAVQPELARILSWARSLSGFKAGLSGSGSSVFLLPIEMVTNQAELEQMVERVRAELTDEQQWGGGIGCEPGLQLDPNGILAMTLLPWPRRAEKEVEDLG